MLSPGLKQTTHNTSQRTVKQSERLPILRRKMRCLPTLQHTTNPYGLRGDTQLKLSHPANHVGMPCQHGTHLNILRQGPRHLPDNKSIIQTPSTSSLQSTGHHQSNRPNFSTKLQTVYDLRNVENYANIRHRRRHYPGNTSTIFHQQHRTNKHLQQSQNAYPYKPPSWTRW